MPNYNFSSTTYSWVELNGDAAATLVIGNVADGGFWANPIALGSRVLNLYGSNITGNNLYMGTSGWLFVGSPSYSQVHTDLSAAPAACAVIAPLWNARAAGGYFAASNMCW